MKYYVYVSESKINMLYDQMGRPEKKERSSTLEFNLKLVKGKFERSKGVPENKFTKLNEAIKGLEKEQLIGSVPEDYPYIRGCIQMKWGTLAAPKLSESPISFWGHWSDNLTLALAGSKYHLLGEQRGSCTDSGSSAPAILSWLVRELEILRTNFPLEYDSFWERADKGSEEIPDYLSTDHKIADTIFEAVKRMIGDESKYEFVAKVLKRFHWKNMPPGEEGFIILATPLYVALVE